MSHPADMETRVSLFLIRFLARAADILRWLRSCAHKPGCDRKKSPLCAGVCYVVWVIRSL